MSKDTNIPAVLTAVIAIVATVGMGTFFLGSANDPVTTGLSTSQAKTQPAQTAGSGDQTEATAAQSPPQLSSQPNSQAKVATPPPAVQVRLDPNHPLRLLVDALVAEYLAIRSNAGAKSDPFDLFAATRKAQSFSDLIDRVAALGDAAVPHLLAALREHSDVDVRTFLAKGLSRMATPQADDALATLFAENPTPTLKTGVILELRKREDAEAGDLMARLYQAERATAAAQVKSGARDQGGAIRAALLRSLAQNDPARHVGALAEAAQSDPDPSVRAQAVDLLWKCPDPIAVALLARMLDEEKDPRILQAAIVSYARLSGDAALAALEDLLDRPSSSERIRASIIYALSQVGGIRAEQTLSKIQNYDRSPAIRKRAASTLAALQRNANTAGDRPRIQMQGTIPLRPPSRPGGQPSTSASESEGGSPGQVPTLPPGARPVTEPPQPTPKD